MALSRQIQNCARGHLHNIGVQSKYRKVQEHSLRHVAGTGGLGGAEDAVDSCVNPPKKDQNENLLTDPTEVVNSDSGLLQLQASFLNHTPLESLGGSFPGLSNASGALRDREGRPTEGGRRGATSSFWAWDLRKLVTGHAPPPSSHWPTAGTCPLLSSLHPGVSFGSVYFSLSTYWTQAGLGIPSYLVRWEGGGCH